MKKDLNYWKNNAEEDYLQVPISALRYIAELEKSNTELLKQNEVLVEFIKKCIKKEYLSPYAQESANELLNTLNK